LKNVTRETYVRFATLLLSSAAILPSFKAIAAEPQSAPEHQQAGAAVDDDSSFVVVFGAGKTLQIQELSGADLAIQVAGTSPLRAIQKLRWCNFTSGNSLTLEA
jgi:iron complex outermembrane receptor protein